MCETLSVGPRACSADPHARASASVRAHACIFQAHLQHVPMYMYTREYRTKLFEYE